MRTMDAIMAIPGILLAIALVSVTGASITTVLVAITIPEIPRVVRLVRGQILTVRGEPYVEAALALGTPLPLPAEQLAIGLLALSDGMQFSYAFDPQGVTLEMTEAVLAGFFRRVVFGDPPPEGQ
ncbi:hypothetical protein G6F22_019478 [Rhizopus arrhizus]|nr:hypothetical protein G6F22_019478 [Rhizopus arrhizus]